jgi:hypothetical protein
MKHQKDEAAPLERDGLSQSDTQPVDSTRSEWDLDDELDQVAGIGSPLEEERELKRLNKKSGMSIMLPCDANQSAPGSISAFARVTDRLERGGSKSAPAGMWQCPAHDDRNPSLHVTKNDDGVLLNCFTGCNAQDIVSALGLDMRDLFDRRTASVPPSSKPETPPRKLVATYEYVDSDGELLSTKQRREPGLSGGSKDFRWTTGNPKVLFELPTVLNSEHIWINEGEKGAIKLQEILPLGHAATCTPTSGWESSFTKVLCGKTVTIIRDRDESGDKQARQAYDALREAGIRVCVVEAAVEAEKADAFDHVEAGYSLDEFVAVDLGSQDYGGKRGSSLGGEFEPLGSVDSKPLPEFPVSQLGGVGSFVTALSAHAQVAPDMAAVCVLGAMASTVARKFQVRLNHTEEISIYALVVSGPGTRKSSVFKEAIDPISKREAELKVSTREAIITNEQEIKILEARAKHLEKTAAKAKDEVERVSLTSELRKVAVDLKDAQGKLLHAPRLTAGDITPERLGTLASQNEERMMIASAEGAQIFDRTFRYGASNEPNVDLILSGHCGDRCLIDRASDGGSTLILERPVLTIMGTIQEHVVRSFRDQAAFAGRGLLDRICFALPPDNRGNRDVRKAVPLDPAAVRLYFDVMNVMLDIPHDRDNPQVLQIEGDAAEVYLDFAQWAEDAQAEDGEFEEMRGWASKSAGLVMRIAGVLAVADQPHAPEITAEVMSRACEIGWYFAKHAKRAFALMHEDEADQIVAKIWRWISSRNEPLAGFTRTELWCGVKNGRIQMAKDLDAPLDRLIRAGRIARRTQPAKLGAGPKAQVFAVNPEALR